MLRSPPAPRVNVHRSPPAPRVNVHRSSPAPPTRNRLSYRKRRRNLLTRRHINAEKKNPPNLKGKQEETARQALNKQNEETFVANALPYRRVVNTAVSGFLRRRIKWQMNFDILMMPNTCQVTDEDAEYVFCTGLFSKDSDAKKWIHCSIS